MFSDLLRLSKQTLTYGAATVLTRMVAFILVPFFTYYMTTEEFGVQQLFYMFIALGTELFLLGLDIALLRYYVLEKDLARRKVIFSTVWYTGFFFATTLALAVVFAAPQLVRLVVELPTPTPDWAIYTLRLCAGILWLEILNAFPFMVLRGEGKAGQFILGRISGAVAQTIFTLITLIPLHRGVAGVFEANLASSLVVAAILAPAVFSRLRMVYDRAMLAACLKFGLPNVPNAVFVIAIDLSSRKILEIMSGSSVTGLFSVGQRLGTFMAIAVAGFRFAWQPFFLSISDRPNAKDIYGRVLTYYLVVVIWMYLLLTAFVEPLAKGNIPGIGSLIAPEFWDGLGVFPIILLAHIFNGAYAVFMVGIYLKKKTAALPLFTGVAAVISVAGNILLIPKYGMWAAAWLTVASYAIMSVLLYFYIQRYYPIRYEWGRIVRLFLYGGIAYGLGALGVRYSSHLPAYIISIFFPLSLLAGGFLSGGEKERVRRLFRRGRGQE